MSSPSSPAARRARRPRAVRTGLDRLESRIVPATFVVNWFEDRTDANPGDGVALSADGLVTLRAAVMEANALGGSHEIFLPAGYYGIAHGNGDSFGDIDVQTSLTIRGSGVGRTVITDGGDRMFDFGAPGEVTLSDMTLIDGETGAEREGGAVRVSGPTRLQLTRIEFAGNTADVGGALYVTGDAVVAVSEATFRNNGAGYGGGGAIYFAGRTLQVVNSAFVGNSSRQGGAITLAAGSATVAQSTLSGNSAAEAGGAILVLGTGSLDLQSDTIAGNAAARGGGVAVAAGTVTVANTILAGNVAADGPDGSGTFTSLGHNLVGNAAGTDGFTATGDQAGTAALPIDPLLSPLDFHGGFTVNRVPLPGSPAVNAGLDSGGFDQRLLPRTGPADIGAVEARTFSVANLTGVVTVPVGANSAPLRVRVSEGPVGLAGVPVTFSAPATGAGGTFSGPVTVLTDAEGVATAPAFQANGVTGTYRIRATLVGSLGIDIETTNVPGPASRIDLAAPTASDEGAAFAVTLTAYDAFGNVATGFTGTVQVTSSDPRATLPPAVTFTEADAGRKTIPGVVLRSAGSQTVSATADGMNAVATVAVANLGPTAVEIDPVAAIDEGQTLTLTGHFANVDDRDAHTVVIRWGDDTPDTTLNLAAGVTTFSADHPYADDLAGTIRVTVTDAAGAPATGETAVTVRNVAPAVSDIFDIGTYSLAGNRFTATGTFADPGADEWTVTVNYGDGTSETVPISASRDFRLEHVYTSEGNFTVVVTVADDDGLAGKFEERVIVFLPGTRDVKLIVVPPGGTATVETNGVRAEFFNASPDKFAILMTGTVENGTLAKLPDAPTTGDGSTLRTYEMRGIDVAQGSRMTVTFRYDPNQGENPVLRFFDAKSGRFVAVTGSTQVANSYVVDRVSHTITVVFDATSNPRPRDLNGTLFTLAVPAPAPPTPTTPTPTPSPALVLAPNLASGATAGGAAGPRVGTPTTSLLTNSEVTLTLASSDSLRRGGSDSEAAYGPALPVAIGFLSNLYDVRDVLVEAFRMWLDQPAPVIAPAVPAEEVAPAQDILDESDLPELPAVVRAAAEPWWLAEQAAAEESADAPIPVPVPGDELTESEQRVAAVLGLWVGTTALAAVAPIPEHEETPADRRRKRAAPKRRWRTGDLDEVRRD